MEDIAITYEKVDNNNGSYNLEPSGIVIGKYDKKYNIFIDNDGDEYKNLYEFDPAYDVVFDNPISFKKLKSACKAACKECNQKFDLSDEEVIARYYEQLKKRYTAIVSKDSTSIDLFESVFVHTINIKNEIDLDDFQRFLKRNVIGQDDAIMELTNIIKASEKSPKAINIILNGPKGTGKTRLLQMICKYLGIPYYETDAITFPNGAIVPKSEAELVNELITAYSGDIDTARYGILVIKNIERTLSLYKGDRAFSSYILEPLVNLTKGTKFTSESSEFDTSNLTVVLEGDFTELLENEPQTGYTAESEINYRISKDILRSCEIPDSLLDNFEIVNTEKLTVENIARIMTSHGSPLRRTQKDFISEGVNLKYEDAFITGIAEKIYKLGCGATSIKDVLNSHIRYAQDDARKHKVKSITLTKKTIDDIKNYDKKS